MSCVGIKSLAFRIHRALAVQAQTRNILFSIRSLRRQASLQAKAGIKKSMEEETKNNTEEEDENDDDDDDNEDNNDDDGDDSSFSNNSASTPAMEGYRVKATAAARHPFNDGRNLLTRPKVRAVRWAFHYVHTLTCRLVLPSVNNSVL